MPPFLGNHTHVVRTTLPTVAAADASILFPVLVAPAGTPLLVKRVSVTPAAAITGANTNTKHINVLDNTTELSTLELVSGTDIAARAETTLYEPATPHTLDAGDVLNIQVEAVGTGILITPLAVVVEFAPK